MHQFTIRYYLDDADKSKIGTHFTKAMGPTHAQETFLDYMEEMQIPVGSIISIEKQKP